MRSITRVLPVRDSVFGIPFRFRSLNPRPATPHRGPQAAAWRVCLVAFASLLFASTALSQTGQTVTWSGGNTFRSWMGTTNWTPGVVPLDDATTKFTVVVPDSTSLRFDSPLPGKIEAFSFGSGSQLLVTNGQPLDVTGVAVLKGLIQAKGAGSAFRAPANTILLSVNPRMLASDGAVIQAGASTFNWERLNASATLISAIGAGSAVDLKSVSTLQMTYGDGGSWTYNITARSNGLVDLSALNNLYGPGQDDVLELNVDTGAALRLNSVQNIGSNIRFNTGIPLFELPEATAIAATTINVTNASVFQAPKLFTMSDVTMSLATNSSFNAALLSSMSDIRLTLRPGAIFHAPQLLTADRIPLTFIGDAAFVATNLTQLKNSEITITPGRRLETASLTNVNGSFVTVSGGTNYHLSALSYEAQPGLAESRSLLSADGLNTLLDAASIRTLRVFGGHWGGRNDHSYYLSASNDGVLDLSGLEIAYGADPASYNGDDWLVFRSSTRGSILLPNLRQVTRRTRFEVQVPLFSLPSLETVDTTVFTMADGSRINAPLLVSLEKTSFDFGFNSTFNAPALRRFVDSELNLAPGRILIAPPFTNLNASRISVAGGSTLTVAAQAYETIPDWRWSPTLFSADGAGSRLDLSSLLNFKTYGADGGSFTTTITANNSGEVDFSGAQNIQGPDAGAYGGDDWLNFNTQNAGKIYLANVTNVTGHTRFNLGAGTSISATDLQRIAGGVTISLAPGSTFAAPSLVQVIDSDLSIGADGTWILPPLTNVYAARLSVSGGRTLHVAAEMYDSPLNWTVDPTIMRAEGPGSLFNAPYLRTLRVHGGHWGGRNDHTYSILAQNQATIDFSGLENLVGANPADYNNDDTLALSASGGSLIKLGSVLVTRRTAISATGNDSTLDFHGLDLRPPSTLNIGPGTTLKDRGHFLFSNTDTNSFITELATLQLCGLAPQTLEAGGKDIGPGSTVYARNFGFNQLIVGTPTNPSVVQLADSRLNAGRGPAGEPEALYLYGLGGQGLRLLSGSRFVMNRIPCYAAVNSVMVDLRTLIPPGANSVAFDGGLLANSGGPAITNLSPAVNVTPPVTYVDVSFNIPIQPSSFTVADVSISGPSGPIIPTTVSPAGPTTWRITFPSQTATGTYTVTVGPQVNEAAANLLGMDQNGDGSSGNGPADSFIGTFTVDGTPPIILSAIGLQGGKHIGVRFNEPVTPAFATNPANFTVNGAAPTQAILQNGTNLVLTVPPVVGESFTLVTRNTEDLLGNKTDRSFPGLILTLSPADIGNVGSNPLLPGTTVTFSGSDFQTVSGGSDFFWSGSDAGHFVNEPRSGDFDLRAQVSRLDRAETYSQAGIMWRESLAPNSRHAYFLLTPPTGGNQYYGVVRHTTAAAAVEWPYSNPSARTGVGIPNAWIRLQRQGNTFIGYRSTNGLDWIELGRLTATFPADGLVGIATSARNNGPGQTTTAHYDNVSDFSPSIASHPQSQAVNSGSPVVFAVTARGLPPLSYQWFFNGQPISAATTHTLTLPSVSSPHVGDYKVQVSNNYGSFTSHVATLVVDGLGLGGFEGDLSPAPSGNNTVTVADWVKAGRLVAHLDSPLNTSEFVRADSAPRMSGSTQLLGDGRLTVADWTQAGRYAAGLDPITPAGGPSSPLLSPPQADPGVPTARSLAFIPARAWLGQVIEVPVHLSSQGNENALGFSVTFHPAQLSCLGVVPGTAAQSDILQANLQNAHAGSVGIVLSRQIGQNFPPGTLEIARLRFAPQGQPGEPSLTFTDNPVHREIVDVTAQPLPSAYVGAAIKVTEPARFSGVKRMSGGGVQLMLNGPTGESCEVQASSDLRSWVIIATTVLGSDPVPVLDNDAPTHNSRFYRVIPRQ